MVYDFTAPITAPYTFDLAPSGWDGELYLLASCAGAGNGMDACVQGIDAAGSGAPEQLVANLTAGENVKVVVDSYAAGVGGAFTLTVTSPLAQECASATPLSINNVGESVTLTGVTAGATYNDSNCGGHFGPENAYLLTPSADVRLDVTVTPTAFPDGGGIIPVVYVSDTCGYEAGELNCNTGTDSSTPVTVEVNRLPADGGPYYIWIDGLSIDGVNGSFGPYSASFTLNAPYSSPANDNCEGTVPLIGLTTLTDGGFYGTVAYDTRYADNTTLEPNAFNCGGYDNGPDVVFQVQFPRDVANVGASLTDTTGGFPALILRSAPCYDQPGEDGGAGSTVACDDFAQLQSGPLPGGAYYIWVDGSAQGVLTVTAQ